MNMVNKDNLLCYMKHELTGAKIPIENNYALSILNNKSHLLIEIERKYNRRFFYIRDLTKRWNIKENEVMDKLKLYEISLSDHFETKKIIVFEEYVIGIEKKEYIKISKVKSKYIGFSKII